MCPRCPSVALPVSQMKYDTCHKFANANTQLEKLSNNTYVYDRTDKTRLQLINIIDQPTTRAAGKTTTTRYNAWQSKCRLVERHRILGRRHTLSGAGRTTAAHLSAAGLRRGRAITPRKLLIG